MLAGVLLLGGTVVMLASGRGCGKSVYRVVTPKEAAAAVSAVQRLVQDVDAADTDVIWVEIEGRPHSPEVLRFANTMRGELVFVKVIPPVTSDPDTGHLRVTAELTHGGWRQRWAFTVDARTVVVGVRRIE